VGKEDEAQTGNIETPQVAEERDVVTAEPAVDDDVLLQTLARIEQRLAHQPSTRQGTAATGSAGSPPAQTPTGPRPGGEAPRVLPAPVPPAAAAVRPLTATQCGLLQLKELLTASDCVFCGLRGCIADKACDVRRKLLRGRPKSRWCYKCDVNERHTPNQCIRTEFYAGSLFDICGHCLWPASMRDPRVPHPEGCPNSRFAFNLKSAPGVFLFRRRPRGFGSWYDLMRALNRDRYIPALSSGELLAELNNYLRTELHLSPSSPLNWSVVRKAIETEDRAVASRSVVGTR